MTNDETRKNDGTQMTKQLTRHAGAVRHSCFGFELSFVIRYSDFIRLSSFLWACVAILVCLCAGCASPGAHATGPKPGCTAKSCTTRSGVEAKRTGKEASLATPDNDRERDYLG